MNPEQEALVLALEAVIQARDGEEADRLEAIYQSRLDDVLARKPGLSRESLVAAIDLAHRLWLSAQKKTSSMPPTA